MKLPFDEKFRNIHYLPNFSIYRKIFVKSNVLITVWKTEKFSIWKNISWNQLFSNLFSNTVGFTKFLSNKSEREFPQFPHCGNDTSCRMLLPFLPLCREDHHDGDGCQMASFDGGWRCTAKSSVLLSCRRYQTCGKFTYFSGNWNRYVKQY